MRYKVIIKAPNTAEVQDYGTYGDNRKSFIVETPFTREQLIQFLQHCTKYEITVQPLKRKRFFALPALAFEGLVEELSKVKFYVKLTKYTKKEVRKLRYSVIVNECLHVEDCWTTNNPEYRTRTFFRLSSRDKMLSPNIKGILENTVLEAHECKDPNTFWMFGKWDCTLAQYSMFGKVIIDFYETCTEYESQTVIEEI